MNKNNKKDNKKKDNKKKDNKKDKTKRKKCEPTSYPVKAPTTPEPTLVPTGTFSPTVTNSDLATLEPTANNFGAIYRPPCGTDRVYIKVEIKTDRYPADTAYTVKDEKDTLLIRVIKGTFKNANTLYTSEGCVRPGCFNFTVTDHFGDGFCCQWGDGYFSLYHENPSNPQYTRGKSFKDEETAQFGDCN